jgi:uncharacterized protein YkwD
MENEIININEFHHSQTEYNSNTFNEDEILIAYDQTYLISSIINEEIENKSQKEKIFTIIIKIIKNILDNTTEEKYRKIKLSNKHIQSLFEITGIYNFFTYLGFSEKIVDNELYMFLNVLNKNSEEKFKLVLSYLQLISSLEDECNYYKDIDSKEEIDLPTLQELNQQNNILDVLKNRYTGLKKLNTISSSKGKDIKAILKETADVRKNNTNYSYDNTNFKKENRIMTINDIRYTNPIDKTINKSNDEIGKKCLQLTNEFRSRNNLYSLQWDDHIWKISYGHSENMGLKKVRFGHDGFNQRIKKLPYYYSLACENVFMCQGYSEYNVAEMAVNGWINSPGHRKNLLSHSSHCAIAIYRNVYGEFFLTQIFIRK